MELVNKDLNLLFVFLVIWEERNLSKAASRLYLSQSAVSHALKRLRLEFDDALFVRDSHGVSPTDFAQRLAPKVRQTLLRVQEMYSSNRVFDPKTTHRNLVIAAGDYFSMTMLEQFVARLAVEAPNVRLICKPVSNIFELNKFEKGEFDLAITAIEVTKKEGIFSQELGHDTISICVRKNHPLVRQKPSPEKYLKLRHINVSNYGSDYGVVDIYLEPLGKKRNVALVSSSFFDAARLLRSTDFALSAPHQICLGLAKDYDLAVYPIPFPFQTRSISMVWHARTDTDPFHAWARSLILSL